MHPHDLGRLGERLSADFLEGAGWRVLARNHRLGRNEVDLVAWKRAVLVFVEVKTRSGRGFGHPLEGITWKDRLEVERVARGWLAGRRPVGVPALPVDAVRFDAIAVEVPHDGVPRLTHCPDAWRPRRSW